MATTVTRNGGQKKKKKMIERRERDDVRYAEKFCNPKIIRERERERERERDWTIEFFNLTRIL